MAPFYSHTEPSNRLSLKEATEKIKERLTREGDTEIATLSEKLDILDELTRFELGRFLILNKGLDGNWSHYIAYEFPRLAENMKPQPSMERTLIEMLGEMELWTRLELVKKLLQKEMRNGISLLSVPCGVMAALSTLDFSQLSDFKLCGVDLDPNVLQAAREFNKKQGLASHTEFLCRDAWNLGLNNQFDIVVSMGLNIFVGDFDKVLDLYRSLRATLKPGGKLMVSFMTPYPFRDPNTERDLSSLNQNAVRLHRIVLSEIVKTGVVNFCSSQQMIDQLKTIGFSKVEIHYSICKSPNFAVCVK